MKKRLMFLLIIILLIVSLYKEPVEDTIDTIGGATNDTYNVDIEAYTGASEEDDD